MIYGWGCVCRWRREYVDISVLGMEGLSRGCWLKVKGQEGKHGKQKRKKKGASNRLQPGNLPTEDRDQVAAHICFTLWPAHGPRRCSSSTSWFESAETRGTAGVLHDAVRFKRRCAYTGCTDKNESVTNQRAPLMHTDIDDDAVGSRWCFKTLQ